jgi:peroxiredoxin Q/BCP
MADLSIGQAVPGFKARTTGDRELGLSELRGKWVVIYFYPKDNTPGCTTEGQDFRDRHAELSELGAVVLGVSRDTLKSHENFKAKFDFPFALVADGNETLCRLFDVIKLKKMYGRESLGVERSTFLIDPEGVLRREWRKVKVKGHAEQVLAALRSLA